MTEARRTVDILVVGAGPAGMAAAVRARESGRGVLVLDDNPAPGGQIWRGGQEHSPSARASSWFAKMAASGAQVIAGARIVDGDAKRQCLTVEMPDSAFEVSYDKLILATGARELFLPFPGWTIPGVMGVGGLQALVKSGLPVTGKRIVVAGSGPLLLAAAAYFRAHGAIVPIVAEQAPVSRLAPFASRLAKHPGKLFQAAALRLALHRSRYRSSCWAIRASETERLESVQLQQHNRVWLEPCEYLAVAYGFISNVELAVLMQCQTGAAGVRVNDLQETSQNQIYCAGECTGIGGVDLSIIEGEIAGYAASGRDDLAGNLFKKRDKARQFAAALESAFALRDELRSLADAGTIICRCEDVTRERLEPMRSWRSAKLQTRCGMGPCQGRICGPILEFLLGLHPESVRPPVFPARVETLLRQEEETRPT
ncbi:MAG: NAD(P)/FAD-dependent oxidoreductase [Acidobacteriaceae bacterium]|nr:NAD(P)/FAD-dependent oxidoreductase [Acidobacteriaceae bacterium]MBV9500858.1 NAD(P)/FAD-dependent oxidoreductase [Acidobacteriaceae bacterium]